MSQNGLTVITKVKSGQDKALEAVLLTIGTDIQGNSLVCFKEMPSLHFACWVILKKENTEFPDQLVLELNYDGDTDGILNEMLRYGSSGLDAIYSLCEGCPTAGTANPGPFIAYLKQNVVPIAGFYIGCRGQSLPSIRNAAKIRASCEDMLDSPEGKLLRNQSPAQIRAAIQAHVQGDPTLKPVSSTLPLPEIRAQAGHSFNMVKVALVLLSLIAVLPILSLLLYKWLPTPLAMAFLIPLPLTVFLLLFVLVLRIHEIRDAGIARPLEGAVDQRVAEKEDVFDMNHMTTLTVIKPGMFRLGTLKFVLWLINLLAKTVFIVGNLGGIPTIHFARWVFTDGDKRLLFFSNYDGSWESYMGDFIDQANLGLTAIWGNTVDFPRTNWLVVDGARRVDEFKRWTRVHNVFNQVWYSAYPDQTIRNIIQSITFREGLEGAMSEEQTKQWLRLL
jgi:hypothetical protein